MYLPPVLSASGRFTRDAENAERIIIIICPGEIGTN